MRNGGFVAGGYARAVALSARGMLRSNVMLSPERHYGDIDVFFEREVLLPELRSMVRECNIDDVYKHEPFETADRICWRDNTADYPADARRRDVGCFYVTFPDERKQKPLFSDGTLPSHGKALASIMQCCSEVSDVVKINVITFKHGSVERLLSDFDVTPCQVAFNGAGRLLVRSDFDRVERDGIVSVNWDILRTRPIVELRLTKTVERLAKYVRRVMLSGGSARILPGELTKIVRVAQSNDLRYLQRISWDTQRTLADASTFEDCNTFAMMVWPTTYLKTKMFEHLYQR